MATTGFFKISGRGDLEQLDQAESSLLAQVKRDCQKQQKERLSFEETPSPTTTSFMIANESQVLWINVELKQGRNRRTDYKTFPPISIN